MSGSIRVGVRADSLNSYPSVRFTRVACKSCGDQIWVPGPTPTADEDPWCANHGGVGNDGRLLVSIVE